VLQKDGFFRKREDKRDDIFFRPATPAAPIPAPAASVAVEPAADNSDARSEAKLVVGPEIKIKGVEISDCDTLVVEGRIEATLDSRVLEITEHGVFQGTIAVDNAAIRGRFEGELTVRKQLVIHATGKCSGKIRYTRIKVEEGAEVAGEIAVLDKAQATPPVARKPAPAPAPAHGIAAPQPRAATATAPGSYAATP
jgi:cytoskeletal protein CcmA (bactofilin family)